MDDRGATTEAYMGSETVGIPQAFVVGRDGKVIAHFGSTIGPTSGTLVGAVQKALAARS